MSECQVRSYAWTNIDRFAIIVHMVNKLSPPQQEDCCERAAPLATDHQQVEEAAAFFAALSDPNRLAILKLLIDNQGEICVCDITGNFALGQPTISHHLKILRDTKFVTTSKRGKWVYYSLDRQKAEEVKTLLAAILSPSGPTLCDQANSSLVRAYS